MQSTITCTEKISVIIPVYNVAEYLSKCIETVINQSYANLEIILVDDGSSDGSAELCDEYMQRDSRIKVIHKENGGSTSSRNAGLKIATGKYVGFVDSDDWIEENMFELLYSAISSCNADIAVARIYIDQGNISYEDEKRSIISGVYEKSDNIISHNIIYTDDYKQRGISPNLWDKLFLREKFIESQAIVDVRTKFAEDDLCVYDCLLKADRVVFIDLPVYHYCQTIGSVTKSSDENYFEKISLFYKQMKEVFKQYEESKLLLEKLNKYMFEFVLRGINSSFGFGYGNVVPFYRPDITELYKSGIRDIILYGAGNVGRDFYSFFKQSGVLNVVFWLDKSTKNESIQKQRVLHPDLLKTKYQGETIVIAVDSRTLAETIKNELISKYRIDIENIFYKKPKKIIEDVR